MHIILFGHHITRQYYVNDCSYQFIQRISIYFMPVKYQPDYIFLRHVKLIRVHLFTAAQVLCMVLMWVVKSVKATSIAFPLMVREREIKYYFYSYSFIHINVKKDEQKEKKLEQQKGEKNIQIFHIANRQNNLEN